MQPTIGDVSVLRHHKRSHGASFDQPLYIPTLSLPNVSSASRPVHGDEWTTAPPVPVPVPVPVLVPVPGNVLLAVDVGLEDLRCRITHVPCPTCVSGMVWSSAGESRHQPPQAVLPARHVGEHVPRERCKLHHHTAEGEQLPLKDCARAATRHEGDPSVPSGQHTRRRSSVIWQRAWARARVSVSRVARCE